MGETSVKKCLVYRAILEGEKEKVGPLLNEVDGRKCGTIDGFSYSRANRSSGVVWNEASLRDCIKDPKAKIPGANMIFIGIK